ncbi:hypothetical protein HDU87_006711 [Geranomyces variabilis]|uniref:Uncharacterized protein n=1 Tax=Geranomyces variabilis TaxID=109894 RepID=A0AAD5TQD6_9FUNG|nr:hypothetical protein HDU87_006711 [Geranomyces variabilis]
MQITNNPIHHVLAGAVLLVLTAGRSTNAASPKTTTTTTTLATIGGTCNPTAALFACPGHSFLVCNIATDRWELQNTCQLLPCAETEGVKQWCGWAPPHVPAPPPKPKPTKPTKTHHHHHPTMPTKRPRKPVSSSSPSATCTPYEPEHHVTRSVGTTCEKHRIGYEFCDAYFGDLLECSVEKKWVRIGGCDCTNPQFAAKCALVTQWGTPTPTATP